ncbi:MAG: hypothetical protein U0V02_12440 [Anaerolineales bacterium]
MLKLFFAFLLFLIQDAPVSINSPQAGQELRGQVQITGNMAAPNFASAELAFKYAASTSADTWFTIQTFSQPVADSTLALWDTTSVTDGDYDLRLRITLIDGTSQDVVVSSIKIRNDSPEPTVIVPTETALPQFGVSTALPVLGQATSTTVFTFPSSTPLPLNPASVTTSSIYTTFARGSLIVLVLFIFFSLILRLRKNN